MKIKTGFVMRTIMGQNLVTGEGLDKANYTKMVKLNDSAAFLWKGVEGKEFTVENLADLLKGEYGIDDATAGHDAAVIAARWKEIGLLED